MSKRKIYILIVIIVLGISGWIFSRNNIEVEFSGIRYMIGEEDFKTVDIRILGTINKHIFSEDEILFEIYVDGVNIIRNSEDELIVPGQLSKRTFSEEDIKEVEDPLFFSRIREEVHEGSQYKVLYIEYNYIDKIRLQTNRYGTLFYDGDFDNVIIGLSEDGAWSSSGGYEVITSEESIEKSIELAWEMMRMKIGE